MKIEGPSRTAGPSKTDKTRKAGGTGGSAFADMLGGTDETEAATATAPVGGVNLFLALQAAEFSTEREARRQAVEQGHDLLDELEDLRVGLLLGNYSKFQLESLNKRLQSKRFAIEDPQLKELLSDIELRAEVELAKYQS